MFGLVFCIFGVYFHSTGVGSIEHPHLYPAPPSIERDPVLDLQIFSAGDLSREMYLEMDYLDKANRDDGKINMNVNVDLSEWLKEVLQKIRPPEIDIDNIYQLAMEGKIFDSYREGQDELKLTPEKATAIIHRETMMTSGDDDSYFYDYIYDDDSDSNDLRFSPYKAWWRNSKYKRFFPPQPYPKVQ